MNIPYKIVFKPSIDLTGYLYGKICFSPIQLSLLKSKKPEHVRAR
jgi:hypothetical protein